MPNTPSLRTEPATPDVLRAYGRVPISFPVTSRVRVVPSATALRLVEEDLAEPFTKDYDALGEHPATWAERFDLTHWAVIGAWVGDVLVGGAVLAHDTQGVEMLEDRADLAVLWDLRVAPEHRRGGVGARLFAACVDWSRARACREMKVETQDVNVAACRLYEAMGCVLTDVVPHAYAQCPDETMLIWRLALRSRGDPPFNARH